MKKPRSKTELNRVEILRQCYRLMVTGTWDAISVTELESNIKQTRGAIFYFNKNKEDLFNNMIDELFLPVFRLNEQEKLKLKSSTAQAFFAIYKTPFERVCNDLRINYQVPDPAMSLFNIIAQAQQHYPNFREVISEELKLEKEILKHILGINSSFPIDIDHFFAQNVGKLFLKSLFGQENGKTM